MSFLRNKNVIGTLHRVALGLSKDEYQKLQRAEMEIEERMLIVEQHRASRDSETTTPDYYTKGGYNNNGYIASIPMLSLNLNRSELYDEETRELWESISEDGCRYIHNSKTNTWTKISRDMEEISVAKMWAEIVESIEESKYAKENLMYEEGQFNILKVIIEDYGSNITRMYVVNDIMDKFDHVTFDSQTYELKVKIPMTPGSLNRPYTRNDIVKAMSIFDKRFLRIGYTD